MPHDLAHAPTPAAVPATTGRTRAIPRAVRLAFKLWIAAVAAGAAESVLVATGMLRDGTGSAGELADGVGLRLAVYAAALALACRLRRGDNWARITQTLLLGVFGTLSLAIGPIGYLADGHTLGDALAQAGTPDLAFGICRAAHITCVLAALICMYRPVANTYFRQVSA
jgi:hypothetical protein